MDEKKINNKTYLLISLVILAIFSITIISIFLITSNNEGNVCNEISCFTADEIEVELYNDIGFELQAFIAKEVIEGDKIVYKYRPAFGLNDSLLHKIGPNRVPQRTRQDNGMGIQNDEYLVIQIPEAKYHNNDFRFSFDGFTLTGKQFHISERDTMNLGFQIKGVIDDEFRPDANRYSHVTGHVCDPLEGCDG